MTSFFKSCITVVIVVTLVSFTYQSDSPKDVAVKFVKAMLVGNFDAAKTYITSRSLKKFHRMEVPVPDSLKQTMAHAYVEYGGYNINDSTVYATVSVYLPNSVVSERSYILRKENGEWKVDLLVLLEEHTSRVHSAVPMEARSGSKIDTQSDKIYTSVQVEAKFPGGEEAWKKYLHDNLRESVPTDNGAPPGVYSVMVSFLVSSDGSISNVWAVDAPTPDYGMAAEALRLISFCPNWQPAIQNGRPVTYRQKQKIVFTVQE